MFLKEGKYQVKTNMKKISFSFETTFFAENEVQVSRANFNPR